MWQSLINSTSGAASHLAQYKAENFATHSHEKLNFLSDGSYGNFEFDINFFLDGSDPIGSKKTQITDKGCVELSEPFSPPTCLAFEIISKENLGSLDPIHQEYLIKNQANDIFSVLEKSFKNAPIEVDSTALSLVQDDYEERIRGDDNFTTDKILQGALSSFSCVPNFTFKFDKNSFILLENNESESLVGLRFRFISVEQLLSGSSPVQKAFTFWAADKGHSLDLPAENYKISADSYHEEVLFEPKIDGHSQIEVYEDVINRDKSEIIKSSSQGYSSLIDDNLAETSRYISTPLRTEDNVLLSNSLRNNIYKISLNLRDNEAQEASQSVEVDFHDENLGEINIRIDDVEGKLSFTLTADSDETFFVLNKNYNDLLSHIRQSGVFLGNFSLHKWNNEKSNPFKYEQEDYSDYNSLGLNSEKLYLNILQVGRLHLKI